MIIQGPGSNPFKVYSEQTRSTKLANQSTKSEAKKQDQVELSSRGQELGQILGQIRQMPDVRTDRLAQLKDQIAQGTYRVDSQTLAQDLLGR